MKKRLIAVAVATLMFVQLTACGADAESNSNSTKENDVVQEVESTQESSVIQDSSEEAPKQEGAICIFEDIEPITMVATTWGNAYYDPNYIAEYEPDNYPYLSTGGNYEAGYEFTFDQKATYEGVEYYSCLFGGGVPGASQFRMLLKASDFVPVENKEMAGNGKQIIRETIIVNTGDWLYVDDKTDASVDTIVEYEYDASGNPLRKIEYELIDSQKGNELDREKYECDAKGNLTKEMAYYVKEYEEFGMGEDACYTYWREYQYDENGKMIKKTNSRFDIVTFCNTNDAEASKSYVVYWKYEYDKDGRISAEYQYNAANDELKETITYEYNTVQTDETGAYTEEVKTYVDGTLINRRTNYYVYDANDILITFINEYGVTDYTYDENGNKISVTVYSGSYSDGKVNRGHVLGSVTYEYAE